MFMSCLCIIVSGKNKYENCKSFLRKTKKKKQVTRPAHHNGNIKATFCLTAKAASAKKKDLNAAFGHIFSL